MPEQILRLGVLVQRRPPVTRWSTGELRPFAVLAIEPQTPPHTQIGTENGVETWYLGGFGLSLWSGDTAHYRDNLNSGAPALWVALRGADPKTAQIVSVSADPNEGEGLASDLDLVVDRVPLPDSVAQAMQAFIDAHHVEMPFKKRKRLPNDPNALSTRGPRVLTAADKWENRKGRGA
jgi:hypothetical protein